MLKATVHLLEEAVCREAHAQLGEMLLELTRRECGDSGIVGRDACERHGWRRQPQVQRGESTDEVRARREEAQARQQRQQEQLDALLEEKRPGAAAAATAATAMPDAPSTGDANADALAKAKAFWEAKEAEWAHLEKEEL